MDESVLYYKLFAKYFTDWSFVSHISNDRAQEGETLQGSALYNVDV